MTRFARAKGSKSSNLKAPEDSTPWEVMKEQMLKAKAENEETKKRMEAEQQRIDNYEKFLKDRKIEKRKAEWCDFPEAQSKKNPTLSGSEVPEIKKKKTINISTDSNLEAAGQPQDLTNKLNKKKKKSKSKNKHPENTGESVISSSQEIANGVVQNNCDEQISSQKTTEVGKNKKKPANTKKTFIKENQVQNQEQKVTNSQTKKKNKKLGDNAVRRKVINESSFQLIINGKDIELVRFDGFPIMKKDAERLQELKNSMIKKGIPKSEVQRTIKLERRRAEKALARIKRDVCYNCRKGGHNLSDCPDLRSNIPGVESADGVCFKCGSTEHRQKECKVQRDKEFRFATCFICRETGHLARQCPDNPKGLYPNGGCCKLCGDVTHLRKDCPTVAEKKEGTSIKLSTLDIEENIEDIGQSVQAPASQEPSKKPKKIKF